MSARADLEFAETAKAGSFMRRWVTPITASAVLLLVTTLAIRLVDVPLQQDHLIFFYLVPTSLIAIRYGSVPAMMVAIGGAFAACYFFYAPRYSFMVSSPLDLLEIAFFSLLALMASQVVSGFGADRRVAKRGPRQDGRLSGAAGGALAAWRKRRRAALAADREKRRPVF